MGKGFGWSFTGANRSELMGGGDTLRSEDRREGQTENSSLIYIHIYIYIIYYILYSFINIYIYI